MPDRPVSNSRGSDNLWSLDAFRGACALIVFFSHWHLWSFFPPLSSGEIILHDVLGRLLHITEWLTWHTGGQHPAVIGFLVLSGFCIHLARLRACADSSASRDLSWGKYLRRRLIRILPTYWCGALLGVAFVLLQTAAPAPDANLAFQALGSPLDIVVRLLGVSAIYPHEVIAGNNILNYVSTELFLYLFFPVFILLLHRMSWALLITLALAAQLLAYLLAPLTSPYWAYNSPLMLGAFWILGAGLAQAWFDGKRLPPPAAMIGTWIVFITLRETLSLPGLNLVLQLLWALICALLIGWMVTLEHKRPELRLHPLVHRLIRSGRVSFSLYVVHSPVMFISAWALHRLVAAPSYGLQLALTLAGSLVFTLLVHRFVELRCISPRTRDRQETNPRPAQP